MAEANSLNDLNLQVGDTFEGYIIPNADALIDPANGIYGWVSDTADVVAAVEVSADPAPAARGSYVATYAVAGPFTLPPLADLNVGEEIAITNVDGTAITVTPQVGEILNSNVDGTFFSDTARQRLVVEKVSATEWQVGLGSSFAGTSARLGEFFFAKSGRTDTGLLAVSAGTVTNGANLYPKWAAMYPEFISGANIVFPADVEGMFLRNLGGNAESEGSSQADGTAVNGLHDNGHSHVISMQHNEAVGTLAVTNGGGGFIGNANTNTGTAQLDSNDNETRPANRAYQLYTIVDGYGDSYAAGTLVAEPARVLLASGSDTDVSGSEDIAYLGGHTRTTIADEFESIELSVVDASWDNRVVAATIPVEQFANVDVARVGALTSGAARYFMLASFAQSPNFVRVFTDDAGNSHRRFRMYGVRKQFNAIRAEDAPVDDQATAGYMDIGMMRMQWGVEPDNTGPGTVTLPAPFANDTYTVTANATQQDRKIAIPSKTTTTFDYTPTNSTGGTGFNTLGTNWIAIGTKP